MNSPAHFMQRALQLAELGLFTTTPNPRVGCVLVKNDHIVGEGWHQQAGQAHAEVNALRQAGAQAHGATAYVTLEPCSHFGRTPPCADALIAAGVGSVVVAMSDPNPAVAGRGIARLQAAGIPVDVGLLQQQAQELNPGFISRMTRGRPWVRLKVATSLDGRTALPNGVSQWITGPEARLDGHRYRARACAILTGIGTILADNPRLNVRDIDTPRQPRRIVVDSQQRCPAEAALLQAPGATLVSLKPASAQWKPELDVEFLCAPATPQQQVDLNWLLNQLGQQGLNEIHVEAGPRLNGALLQAGLVDEIVWYQAPVLLGPGRPAFELPERQHLTELPRFQSFQSHSLTPVGNDWRLVLRP